MEEERRKKEEGRERKKDKVNNKKIKTRKRDEKGKDMFWRDNWNTRVF